MNSFIKIAATLQVIILLGSCAPQLTKKGDATFIALDASISVDSASNAFIQPYKSELEAEMNKVIGYAPESLIMGSQGETLLGNLISDLQKEYARDVLGYDVDISVMNNGGIRNIMPQGNITVGNVFEISPFENFLYIIELSGSDVEKLANYIAQRKGMAISGMKVTSENNELVHFELEGQRFDPNKNYLLAINDYLASGGSNMDFLIDLPRKEETDLLLRQMIIERIEARTAEGKKITASIEGRQTHN